MVIRPRHVPLNGAQFPWKLCIKSLLHHNAIRQDRTKIRLSHENNVNISILTNNFWKSWTILFSWKNIQTSETAYHLTMVCMKICLETNLLLNRFLFQENYNHTVDLLCLVMGDFYFEVLSFHESFRSWPTECSFSTS